MNTGQAIRVKRHSQPVWDGNRTMSMLPEDTMPTAMSLRMQVVATTSLRQPDNNNI